MRNPLKKSWFWVIVVLAAIAQALLLIGPGIGRYLYERKINEQAEAWLDRAKQECSARMTPEQAKEWLRENGFSHIAIQFGLATSENNGPWTLQMNRVEVTGERELARGLRPAWLELRFTFKGKKFLAVESEIRPFATEIPKNNTGK
jgi:hypothetical protein